MAEQPFLPFFVGDFLGATVTWEGEERALYMLMLAYQWSGGPLPADLEKLSRALGYPHQKFMSLWQTVGEKFEVRKNRLVNDRLERHRARTLEISDARSTAGSVGGKASAAKRAAQAAAKVASSGEANPQASSEATPQAIVKANAEATVQASGQQISTILSDPILSNPIRSNPCVDPERASAARNSKGATETATATGVAKSPEPHTHEPIIDSLPYEQTIQARFPKGPNPPNWLIALRNAHSLVEEGLSTWPELVGAVERYASYCTGEGGHTTNVAAHNFFDRRKGNYWQQDWKPSVSKAEQRLEGNLAAAAEAKRQLFGGST